MSRHLRLLVLLRVCLEQCDCLLHDSMNTVSVSANRAGASLPDLACAQASTRAGIDAGIEAIHRARNALH